MALTRSERAVAAQGASSSAIQQRFNHSIAEKNAFLGGVLAALDHLIGITHDEPVIAAEIVRAVGARDLMLLAKEQDYPFLQQLRDLYRKENIEW